jgi:hypothetical protein
VGLERGPLSLVSTTEQLLGRKNSGSGLETRDVGTNFDDKRRSLDWYSSQADSIHGVYISSVKYRVTNNC